MANEEEEVIIPNKKDEEEEEEIDEEELDENGKPKNKAKDEEELDENGKPKVAKKKETSEETPEAKRARLKRQLEQQEKKMGITKEPASKVAKKDEAQISNADMYVLIKNDVHEDDVKEVADFAKLKGISIKEALSSSVVKSILQENKENRETAAASNTGTVKRGSQKPNADTLLSEAKKGNMPESDEDMRTVIKKRKGIK